MQIPEEASIRRAVIDIMAVLGPYTRDDDMLPLPAGPDPRLELCGNQYEWYYAYARAIRPKAVLEIGVLKGYSSVMFVSAWPAIRELWLLDNESYGVPLALGVEAITRAWNDVLAALPAVPTLSVIPPAKRIVPRVLNTQSFDDLPEGHGRFDLIHVDGDHSAAGAHHDLTLAWPCLAPGGLLVIDDVDDHAEVREGAQRFLSEVRPAVTHVPSYRGHYLIRREGGA